MPEVSSRIRSKPAAAGRFERVVDRARQRQVRCARRHRAHVHARSLTDRIHADAVAEQRAAGLAPRGIDRQDREAIRGTAQEARSSSSISDDLPAPPVPVMPSTGASARARGSCASEEPRCSARGRSRRTSSAGDVRGVACLAELFASTSVGGDRKSARLQHVVDHALRARSRPSSGE